MCKTFNKSGRKKIRTLLSGAFSILRQVVIQWRDRLQERCKPLQNKTYSNEESENL